MVLKRVAVVFGKTAYKNLISKSPNNPFGIVKRNFYFAPEAPRFPGAKTTWTEQLEFTGKHSYESIPVYRVMDRQGKVIRPEEDPNLPPEMLVKMYKDMILLDVMDTFLSDAQRKGRISFYLTNFGEEATQIGTAAALETTDLIYGQYREVGVLVWRGYTFQQFIDQCYGNKDDEGRGKQMPIHYGSKDLNFVTISSPLTTQLPQAVGSAYALKGKNKVVATYFGDGSASEGDAHAALNFAATLECPVLFICRNNGFAISTPIEEQYRGDGIAGRGPGYGINTIRVDGNDVLAVYKATKRAKEYAIRESKPILIEAMTYRVGEHTSSDDSSAYRSMEDVRYWTKNDYPTNKLRYYLTQKGLWDDGKEKEWSDYAENEVAKAFEAGEEKKKPKWEIMFDDVYKHLPKHLERQKSLMLEHVNNYGQHYPLDNFETK